MQRAKVSDAHRQLSIRYTLRSEYQTVPWAVHGFQSEIIHASVTAVRMVSAAVARAHNKHVLLRSVQELFMYVYVYCILAIPTVACVKRTVTAASEARSSSSK